VFKILHSAKFQLIRVLAKRWLNFEKYMIDEYDTDYWISNTHQSETRSEVPPLFQKVLKDISPLADFAVTDPKNIPDALRDTLFEQTDQMAGYLHTYAVLDAAQIVGLKEMLEASGLKHACLFQGKAAEEMRDVAPWLVRLSEENSFTRLLFTDGDATWHMWGKSAYILLRSSATLDEVRTHLRRFTKFEDTSGKWHYFRFYEPRVLHTYLEVASRSYSAGFFDGPNETQIDRLIYRYGEDWFETSPKHPSVNASSLVDPDAANRIALFMAADRELSALLKRNALTNATVPGTQQQNYARSVVAAVHEYGFRGRYHLRYFIAWTLIYGVDLDQLRGEFQPLLLDRKTSVETRFQAISELIRSRLGQRMEALFD